MQANEDIALPKMQPKIWTWWVDKTFAIIEHSEIEKAQTIVNIFHGTRFTSVMGNDMKRSGKKNGKQNSGDFSVSQTYTHGTQ